MPFTRGHVSRALRRSAVALALCAVAAGCARQSPATPTPPTPSPFLVLRLAYSDSARGRDAARHGDTTVFLAPEVLLSDEDILRARPDTTPGGELFMRVWYRPGAAQRLAAATGAHVGTYLAVLLHSRVWSLTRIQSAIGRGDSLAIATSATGADAEHLAAQIRSRWPVP